MDENLLERNISDEMEGSFLDYSMSVIVSRALPDVRDGLKPVHRRILYGMNAIGITSDKKHKKSARIVGEIIGKYHPHGDTAVYDSMVRMAQDFSYRYPLVDGHGNFGSMDGDGAAAMRYTEAKPSKLSTEMIRDLNKNTVDFQENFDGEEKEPVVLPSRIPNILINGTMGIAVGMATNIPPHNLTEVIDGLVAYINNNDITTLELMEHIKGPDFPTGANILGNSGIKQAYETGKGSLTIRATTRIEEHKNRNRIIVEDIPYQVNKASMVAKMADLAINKVIEGIADIRDESSLKGIRVVIELKKDANPNVVLNNLYKHTPLQTSFGINLLALSHGQPKIMKLKEILYEYLLHQKEVIVRRTKYDLEENMKREHILEGLKIALDNIDAVIKIIKESKSEQDATDQLMSNFKLSKVQSESILEMKLRRLTSIEREKIEEKLLELINLIKELKELLASDEKIEELIVTELLEVKNKYGDERRTNIDMTAIEFIEDESLIPEENIVITLTKNGYVKRTTEDTYRSQNRGGVGVKGITTNEEDQVEFIINASTHDDLLFFTNLGKVYKVRGYKIPEFSRQSKGIPLINIINITPDESITSVLSNDDDVENNFFVFCTLKGIVKKTKLAEFESIRTNGKIALGIKEDDSVISVQKCNEESSIMIATHAGRLIRFENDELRFMGRTAFGVKGISISEDDYCIGCEIITGDQKLLCVTEYGYGKITEDSEYKTTHRGGKGIKAMNITEKTGKLVGFKLIRGDEDILIITNEGIIIRTSLEQINQTGRVSQGVKMINLKNDSVVSSIEIMEKTIEEEINEETPEETE